MIIDLSNAHLWSQQPFQRVPVPAGGAQTETRYFCEMLGKDDPGIFPREKKQFFTWMPSVCRGKKCECVTGLTDDEC